MRVLLLVVVVCQRLAWGLEKPDCPVRGKVLKIEWVIGVVFY